MDICLIKIPKTNGYEQHGLRPAIILSKPNKNISIILPITSNILAKRFEYTLFIEPNIINGLSAKSIILLFQIRAIDSSRIIKKIGKINKETNNEIKNNLKKMLNLIN